MDVVDIIYICFTAALALGHRASSTELVTAAQALGHRTGSTENLQVDTGADSDAAALATTLTRWRRP